MLVVLALAGRSMHNFPAIGLVLPPTLLVEMARKRDMHVPRCFLINEPKTKKKFLSVRYQYIHIVSFSRLNDERTSRRQRDVCDGFNFFLWPVTVSEYIEASYGWPSFYF